MTPEQKIYRYLVGKFRAAWRYYDENRKQCLKASVCFVCKKSGKLVADHREPVVDPKTGFSGWDEYYHRMFEGKLDAMCMKCHASKTKKENLERKKFKKIRKMP